MFPSVLPELVEEISVLRSPVNEDQKLPIGSVANKMTKTVMRYHQYGRITPMICVAGAVADAVLQIMLNGRQLERAYVNNGGDIALHLSEHKRFDIGVCENPDTTPNAVSISSTVRIESHQGIGGIATSGWRGRSHSLGIADAVTVLADTAVNADAAATLIANAVDLPDSEKVTRVAAHELNPDSDLKQQAVTTDVQTLNSKEISYALQSGVNTATRMLRNKQCVAAFISLQGTSRVVGHFTEEESSARYLQQQQVYATGATYA